MGKQAEKIWYRKSNRTWQNNKRGDSKVGWNDIPEIPDRGVGVGGGETSDIHGLLSGSNNEQLLLPL